MLVVPLELLKCRIGLVGAQNLHRLQARRQYSDQDTVVAFVVARKDIHKVASAASAVAHKDIHKVASVVLASVASVALVRKDTVLIAVLLSLIPHPPALPRLHQARY